jgi:hypothetical protein
MWDEIKAGRPGATGMQVSGVNPLARILCGREGSDVGGGKTAGIE